MLRGGKKNQPRAGAKPTTLLNEAGECRLAGVPGAGCWTQPADPDVRTSQVTRQPAHLGEALENEPGAQMSRCAVAWTTHDRAAQPQGVRIDDWLVLRTAAARPAEQDPNWYWLV